MASTAPSSAFVSENTTPASSVGSPSSMVSGSKPKVLLFGEYSDTKYDAILRQVAEVHCLPRVGYEDMVPLIRRKVEEEGEFVAFGGLFLITDNFPGKWDVGLLGPLAPACKLYVGPGAGYDKVDVEWITGTGAMYANSPSAVGERTANGALMLILSAMRGMTPQDHSVRAGKWRSNAVKTLDWTTATIGIIGLGAIGTRVANMLTAIGASSIVYHSRRPSPTAQPSWGYRSLDELYAEADVIVLCCPLTPATTGLIDRRAIGKMKDGVVLVNVSRGQVVREADLVEALDSGKVMRAALDVFENEPEVHPGLLRNTNVTLSPHVAAAPDGMGPALNGEVVQNIIEYIETGMPLTPVNISQLEAEGYTLPSKA
ncbi:hypothetical protein IAU60_002489 [Kwoniella sp. DSM 27419]